MSAADRITELRRQRAQIQDHLAWLDREIAAEEKKNAPSTAAAGPIGGTDVSRPVRAPSMATPATVSVSATSAPLPAPVPPAPAPTNSSTGTASATAAIAATDAAQSAEAVMDEYRVPTADLQKDVRNGCLLYFAAAVLILAGFVAVLYYALRR